MDDYRVSEYPVKNAMSLCPKELWWTDHFYDILERETDPYGGWNPYSYKEDK